MKKKDQKLKVVQNPEKPIAVEVLASGIMAIAEGMRKINESRLSRKAIIALIHDNSKVQKGVIELVLNNLESMDTIWLKKNI